MVSEINSTDYLPEWFSLETSKNLTIVALVLLGILLLLVLRFISKIVIKFSVIIIILALAFGIWNERSELSGCINTCDCEIFGQRIQIPLNRNPFCDEF
jgi:hypothetical protein